MKPLPIKKRRQIYLEAAEKFYLSQNFYSFICGELLRMGKEWFWDSQQATTLELYPELELFKPDFCAGGTWFNEENQNEHRVIALLFMYQMTFK